MPMTPETSSIANKLCPTCGTRLSADATRCIVCGAELGSSEKPVQAAKAVQGSKMPEITLSLPAALGLLALFLGIGAVMVFFALRSKPEVIIQPTITTTATLTVTPSLTPTQAPPTATHTPEPSPTPFTYVVKANDTCSGLAGFFGVSVLSIVQANNLSTECILSVNTQLLIPYPTPTVTPLPPSTLSALDATDAACEKVSYEVQEGDPPSTVAVNFNVPWQSIKEENGLPGDTVFLGQTLIIPLCMRATPVGPTPTPTLPPPYPAPNLLLPAHGAAFTLADDIVTLQWASVGTLRDGEYYQESIEDITAGTGTRLVEAVKDTKYIVPATSRPNDRSPHAIEWRVLNVPQTGPSLDRKAIYETA
ncbi:MAG: LysM peptidoglycan-binding domain-containing protein, partial [Chloroflexota bacterium]